MSVEPWIDACPRRARIPPPGRPMFPSSSWRIEAVRMYCTPTVCCVQPDRVAERRRPLPTGVRADRFGNLEEEIAGNAADLFDHLGRVAGEVTFDDLEHAVTDPAAFRPAGFLRSLQSRRLEAVARAPRWRRGRAPLLGTARCRGRTCRVPDPIPRTAHRGPRCPGTFVDQGGSVRVARRRTPSK